MTTRRWGRSKYISPRQEKILACYSAGMSRCDIARKLKINTNALECAEDLISDYYKEYDMTDCARKWQQERRNQNEQHT